ncbi:MAG TPA: SBBP repeat-containing protein [Terriglobia bacterium]|jgi:hypothetical protein
MSFEPNRGQFDRRFEFGARRFGYSLLVNSTTVELKFRTPGSSAHTTLEMVLHGANPGAGVRGTDALPGEANYFQGSSENWITHIPTYQDVEVKDVYPGVDAIYYGNEGRFEYDFTVAPGASAKLIDIGFERGAKLKLSGEGDLLITVGRQEIRQSKPTTYQNIDGRRTLVDSKYVLHGGGRAGFEVAGYDHSKPLIIDPQLVYSTFAPGMTREYGIAVDSGGNAYLAGTTDDGGPNDQATNAFVAKLNASGTAFLWFSSFGSSGYSDSATAIAVDAAGNAYATGWTEYGFRPPYPPFPTTSNAIHPAPTAGWNAFVTKFDTNGNVTYSTYLGGDRADGIAVDPSGNTYIAGQASSAAFPTTRPFQSTLRGSADAFVTVLNAQGSAFIYSTYLGGGGSDAATAIAVDGSGNAYVAGTTTSTDFPTADPIQSAARGGTDAFIVKLNPAGSALMYGTYLGGSGTDIATGIALDTSENAYISGRTNSPNFPTASAFQPALHGGFDVFVTKVNSAGTALAYSTYLGGSNDEITAGIWCEEKPTCAGIAVNGNGNAYVTDVTASPDFPQVNSMQPFKGTTDAFVSEFSVDGKSLVYSTLIGGANAGNTNAPPRGSNNAFTSGSAVAYMNGNLYVTGLTDSYDFPGIPNAQGTCCVNPVWNGTGGFIAKVADDTTTSGGATTFTRVEQNSSAVTYTGTWYSNSGSFNSGSSAVLAESQGSRATFTFTGIDARWIGYKDAWSGIANVYVDGVLKTTVDDYSASDQAQAVLYTISGLAAGTHTLAVEVSGNKNPSAQADWIWVDAFDYASNGTSSGGGGTTTGGGGTTTGGTGTFTRVEQNKSAVTYTGTWYTNNGSFNSGGSAVLAEDAGSRATFTFTGTDARWIGYKDAWSGIANVYVDGVLKTTVDAYSANSQAQAVLYTISGLAAGTHTLAVEASGNQNPSAQAGWIWVDAFDYASNGSGSGSGSGSGGTTTGGGTTSGGTTTFKRVEQNNSAVVYTGSWYGNAGSFNSGGSAVLAINSGSRATFTFTGTAVKWIGYRDQWSGIANIYIDGALKSQVDTYSASEQAQAVNYATTGLASGTHTITIEVTGNKDASAQSAWVWVDAFDYLP